MGPGANSERQFGADPSPSRGVTTAEDPVGGNILRRLGRRVEAEHAALEMRVAQSDNAVVGAAMGPGADPERRFGANSRPAGRIATTEDSERSDILRALGERVEAKDAALRFRITHSDDAVGGSAGNPLDANPAAVLDRSAEPDEAGSTIVPCALNAVQSHAGHALVSGVVRRAHPENNRAGKIRGMKVVPILFGDQVGRRVGGRDCPGFDWIPA